MIALRRLPDMIFYIAAESTMSSSCPLFSAQAILFEADRFRLLPGFLSFDSDACF